MALRLVLVLVLGSKLALADEVPGHGRSLETPISLAQNPEEQAWIEQAWMDAQLLKTNYIRDDPRGIINTVDLLKQNGGAGRVRAALQTLQWDFKISPADVKNKMTEPPHVHPHLQASDITVSVLRKSSKRTSSTQQTDVSQNTSPGSGQQKSFEPSDTVTASHVTVVERIHQAKVASVWQKPAVQPTEHAMKPGKINEVSHAVPQAQSAAQPAEHAAKPVKIKEVLHAVPQVQSAARGQKDHKDDHKERVAFLRKQRERQAALRKQKEHESEVKALRAKSKSVQGKKAPKIASALKKLDHSKSESMPGENHELYDSNADGKQSVQDGQRLERYYLAGNAGSMKKLMQLMLDKDGLHRVESAFSELQRLGYDAMKVQAWMDQPRHSPLPQTLDEIVARKAKLSVDTKATSPVQGQHENAEEQSLSFSREKTSESTAEDSSDVAEQSDNQAEIDAQLFEGDIIGSDSNGMKDVMQLILNQGGQQRLAAALAALESRGYDSVVVESWLAGKTGPPVKEQKAMPEENHAGDDASNGEGSMENDGSAGSKQILKQEQAAKHAGNRETHLGKDDRAVFKTSIHPWGGRQLRQNLSGGQASEAEQAVADASSIEAHMGKHDGAALKQALMQLLPEAGQGRMERAIGKLEEKGYSQDELHELFMSHRAKKDATEIAFLQLPGSVIRKALRSAR